ncbi:hypothetical protein KAW64_12930 [bacterium]|nr:hypothetical protein [bacterium]
MDRLEKLRSDLLTKELNNEIIPTDDVLAIVDEFCAEHEVVEVAAFPANKSGASSRVWREGWPKDGADNDIVFRSIIVPRTVPTLLEAAEALDLAVSELADMGNASGAVMAWQAVYNARATLAAAISIEELAFRIGEDAEVIGLCPTCGGKRYVTGAEDFPGGDEGYDVTCSRCPDCADAPVWVIEPAAMEAFVCAVHPMLVKTDVRTRAEAVLWFQTWSSGGFDDWWERASADCVPVLQALLPGARVAESVGYIHDNSPGDPTFYLWAGMDTTDVDGYEVMKHQVAILATEAREEVEE